MQAHTFCWCNQSFGNVGSALEVQIVIILNEVSHGDTTVVYVVLIDIKTLNESLNNS